MRTKVYFVGAGPGKEDLITLRGLNILREADVIIYDYLADPGLLEYAKDTAELICCDKIAKKGRYSDGFSIHQEKIDRLIIKKAKEGKKVARLKNGDPSVFSRCSQELDALRRNGVEFELVPGVTAATAAACFTGIPLTDRRFASSCVFVTGREDPKKDETALDWEALSKVGTLVLYMSVESLSDIVANLLRYGRPKKTPVAVVQNASLPQQKVITGFLENIYKKVKIYNLNAPAIFIIGEVVRFESVFNWLKRSKRVLFTGLSKERFFDGKIYFHLPMIKIVPYDDYTEFDKTIGKIEDFDWVVFSSRYGVEYFFRRLKSISKDSRALYKTKVAAIGNSTSRKLLEYGILADLVPKNESSVGLLEEFSKIDLKGKRIFLPRSDISDKGLGDGLRSMCADVTTRFAYKNIMPPYLPDLDFHFFNEIVFTSPSGVRNFKKRYRSIPKGIKISCIGEVTHKEVRRCGFVD